MRSISAAAIASSAASLTPEPSVASARDARLAAAQISATEIAVGGHRGHTGYDEHEIVAVDGLLAGARQQLADVGWTSVPAPGAAPGAE